MDLQRFAGLSNAVCGGNLRRNLQDAGHELVEYRGFRRQRQLVIRRPPYARHRTVIFGRWRFRMMMERTAYLRDKAARLRGFARMESDPGLCRALLTQAGDCEMLADSIEDNAGIKGAMPVLAARLPRYVA